MPKDWDLDGYFKIDVQQEGVFLTVYSPIGNGERVELEEVMEQIESRNLTSIDRDLVELAVQESTGEPVKIGEPQPEEAKADKSELLLVEISDDEMYAYLTILPPRNVDEEITVDDVKNELSKKGVVYGIDEDAISEALIREEYNKVISVAKGTPPVPGQNAVVELKFEKDKKKAHLKEGKNGRVDFRELHRIENVEVGQVLAVKTPPTKGVPGRTVTGREIKAPDGEDVVLPAGRNTEVSPNGLEILSTIRGHVIWTGSQVEVEDSYRVSGDVDLETGNIDFAGNVIIDGNVREGFVVKSGQNIEVRGTVERASLIADGDIEIGNGIIGKGGGEVKAKGSIRAKFIENGNVKAGKDVIVSESILHSNVDAGGKVLLVGGKRGTIIGGRIRAKDEVNARTIGSPAEVPTEIEVGIDPRLREEVLNLEQTVEADKKTFRELKLGIKTLIEQKNRYGGVLPPEKEETLRQYFKAQNLLMEKLHDITERITILNRELSSQTGGKISIFNVAYRGVKVCIGTTTLYLRREYKYTTFTVKAGKMSLHSYEEPVIEKKKR
jgi:hypothetical protein